MQEREDVVDDQDDHLCASPARLPPPPVHAGGSPIAFGRREVGIDVRGGGRWWWEREGCSVMPPL